MNEHKTRKRVVTAVGAPVNEIGKLPPQAVELEEAVLGAVLLEKEAVNVVIDILTPESFYKEQNGKVFNAILTLFKINEPIDLLTVTQELKRTGELEFVGGSFYVSSLTNRIASSANIEFHARIVAQKFIQRELIRIGTQTIRAAYEEGTDCFDLLEDHEKDITGIISGLNIPKGMKSDKLYAELLERNKKILENPNTVLGVETGFTELNNLMKGWQNSDLILLAARPGQGKTALSLCLAKNAVLSGTPTAIFSLEMSSEQLYRRMAAQETEIPHDLVKNGMDPATEALFIRDMAKLRDAPLFIDDSGGLSIFQLRNKARKLKREEQLGLIIVDYLQLMSGTGKEGNREQEISTISRGLKSLAKELNIPIIALSQLSRQVEQRPDKRPQLSDLRDSGCLTADTIIQCPSLKKSFRIKDLIYRKKINIFATDYKTNKIMEAKKCFYSGEKEVFLLELLNGQGIKATSNHKFLTDSGWVELKDLIGKKVAIPVSYGDIKQRKINDNEISLVGHFLANGSAIKSQPIRYSQNIKDDDLTQVVINDAIKATKNLVAPVYKDTILEKSKFRTIFFKPTFHLTHGKTSPIADIMRKYGLFDKRTKDKFIPDEFNYLSHKQTALFLKSLFSGDGTVYFQESKGRKTLKISYSSASEKLIFGIQQLLAKIGIVSFITLMKNKKNQQWYNLYIAGKSNISLFVEKVGFWNKRKNDILLNGWEKSKSNLAGWNKYSFNEERTLCFMPVKKITPVGKQDVYDIEVPKLHNFVANNFIVHNSLEQDADMVFFIYNPEYYGITQDADGNSTHGIVQIINAKNRHGATKEIYLKWIGSLMKFMNQFDPEPVELKPQTNNPLNNNNDFLTQHPNNE